MAPAVLAVLRRPRLGGASQPRNGCQQVPGDCNTNTLAIATICENDAKSTSPSGILFALPKFLILAGSGHSAKPRNRREATPLAVSAVRSFGTLLKQSRLTEIQDLHLVFLIRVSTQLTN